MSARARSAPARLARSLLGLREHFVVGGVRYKETSAETLSRALSPRGRGFKEYAVTFAGGRRMRVRVTPTRPYADLDGPSLLPIYLAAEPFVRPGMRVLAMRSGTGYAAEWLSQRVGPSGAVVALDDDAEAVRYARWRYPLANVAFETGHAEALSGEADGAFDAAVLVHALREPDPPERALAEAWRVLAPGGWLMATVPRGQETRAGLADPPRPLSTTPEDLLAMVARATVAGRARAEPQSGGGEEGEGGEGGEAAGVVRVRVSMIVPPACPADCAGVFTVKPSPPRA